jgi:hypothetical protein
MERHLMSPTACVVRHIDQMNTICSPNSRCTMLTHNVLCILYIGDSETIKRENSTKNCATEMGTQCNRLCSYKLPHSLAE